jgi:predicted nucleic acid-binding protein
MPISGTLDWVLIDTCIWVPFFNRPYSEEKRAVDALLDEDRGALIGPVLAEVLCGFRRDARADWVASSLRGLHYLEVAWDDWRAAAKPYRQLAKKGHEVPLSDLAQAAVARGHECSVYSTDPHFDLIPNLKRYRPV